MSSTISSSSTLPAYAPSLTSLPTTPLDNEGHATIDIESHQEENNVLPQAKSWLRRWFSRRPSPSLQLLSPEAEYERELRGQVTSGTVYFTLAIAILIGSCIGAGVSISNLKRSLAYTEPPAPRTLDDFLHLSKDSSSAYTDEGPDLSDAADVYLVAICCFSAVASLIFSLLSGGRLALAVHYRNLSNQDKPQQETVFWTRMSCMFGSKSMCVKKPQLPTYGHAVRQAVLKRDARQGDAQSEFFNISAEEMELERIRKLGGAPPSYHHDKVAYTETA